MKSEKFSKRTLDDETADLIDSEYPPELDIDRIFRKSYKGFLNSTASSENETEIIIESAPVEVIHKKNKSIFSIGSMCAAFCLFLAVMLLKMPDYDNDVSDEISKPPIIAENSTTTQQSVTTTSSANITTSTTTTTASTTTTTAEPMTEPAPIIATQSEELTTIPTESPVTEELTTIPTTTTSTSETTTEATTTTDRKDNPYGYFTVQKFEGASYMNIRYERTDSEPVTLLEHTMNVDYYSCELLSEYPGANMVWELKTAEDNPPILFQEFAYEYFLRQFDILSEITFTEINGRPAILGYSQGSYCLAWDDGCHVCALHAYEPDYDFMFEFAENYK